MQGRIVIVGGANMDVVARTQAALQPATSNPGHVRLTPGGVGRNVAEGAARLGAPVALVSVVGDDAFGDEVVRVTAEAGVDVSDVRRSQGTTGTYLALLDDTGELIAGISDMALVDSFLPDGLDLADTAAVVVDGNLSVEAARTVVEQATAADVPLVLEPVSAPKAARLAPLLREAHWLLVTPNREELAALSGRPIDEWEQSIADLHGHGVEHVWLRMGPGGSLVSTAGAEPTHVPVVPGEVVDVTGAGDSMLAAWLAAWSRGTDPAQAARLGHLAAAATVASPHTVRPDLARAIADFEEGNPC